MRRSVVIPALDEARRGVDAINRARAPGVEVVVADEQPNGWKHWRDFEIELERTGKNRFPSPAEALEADSGKYIGFVRFVGIRNDSGGPLNLYDPASIAQFAIGTS